MSVCITVPSWTLEPSPISIHSLSPRSTDWNHTLAPAFSRTRPITRASGATQASSWMSGVASPRSWIMVFSSAFRLVGHGGGGLRHRVRVAQEVPAARFQVVVQLVGERDAGGDVEASNLVVRHAVQHLHQRAQA